MADDSVPQDDVPSLHAKMDRVLAAVGTIASNRAEDYQRLNRIEEGFGELSKQVGLLVPPMRLPAPSITGEERKAQTESIRVAAETIAAHAQVTTETAKVISAQTKATKWAPTVVAIAVIVSTFLQAFIQAMK